MIELLQSISDDATQHILDKYKRLFPYCAQGAGTLVRRAGDHGIKLVKQGGFHGFTQHWWCVEPESGLIIDPTAGQFGRPNGIQWQSVKSYHAVPAELVHHLPHRDGSIQDAWFSWERLIKAGAPAVEKRGEYKTETRVDKKGFEYVYQSYVVEFTWSTRPQVRSSVTWHKGDITWGFETMQRRFVGKDGTVKYSTYQRKFKEVYRNGMIFSLRKDRDTGKVSFVHTGFYRTVDGV